MTAPIPDRLICPVCPVCGKGFAQEERGRPRKFCSNSCRQEAHVQRRIARAIAAAEQETP